MQTERCRLTPVCLASYNVSWHMKGHLSWTTHEHDPWSDLRQYAEDERRDAQDVHADSRATS